MNQKKVINSPAADLPRNAKKAEGKKRKSPCTPIEKKARGKKTDGALVEPSVASVRARKALVSVQQIFSCDLNGNAG
jgi:hypothetical protein